MRAPIGHRIRKRRQELSLSQTRLAAEVGISSSYLNLIEHNKRAIGGRLLLRIAEAIDLDSRVLAGTEEARLIAELVELADDPVLGGVAVRPQDAGEIVAHSPVAARAMLALYRAYREARLHSDMIGERLGEETFLAEASNQILALITTIRSYSEILIDYGDLSEAERGRFIGTLVSESERLAASAVDMFDFMAGRGHRRPRPSPREEIEDLISDRANHFPSLEVAAEATGGAKGAARPPTLEALAARLQRKHGVTVARVAREAVLRGGERYDAAAKMLALADTLSPRSARFRLAAIAVEPVGAKGNAEGCKPAVAPIAFEPVEPFGKPVGQLAGGKRIAIGRHGEQHHADLAVLAGKGEQGSGLGLEAMGLRPGLLSRRKGFERVGRRFGCQAENGDCLSVFGGGEERRGG